MTLNCEELRIPWGTQQSASIFLPMQHLARGVLARDSAPRSEGPMQPGEGGNNLTARCALGGRAERGAGNRPGACRGSVSTGGLGMVGAALICWGDPPPGRGERAVCAGLAGPYGAPVTPALLGPTTPIAQTFRGPPELSVLLQLFPPFPLVCPVGVFLSVHPRGAAPRMGWEGGKEQLNWGHVQTELGLWGCMLGGRGA